jgi:ubiquinone/menaquinone biosynthesis C-methylase UbiE
LRAAIAFCQNRRVSDGEPFRPAGLARSWAYGTLWRCANALQKAANACLHLAAGIQREPDLRTASRIRWTAYGMAPEGDTSTLDEWERRLYDELLAPADRVLLVGCGSGRDVLALCERGHEVTGLDQSAEAVALAQRRVAERRLSATLIASPVETAVLDGQLYDAIIFSSGCYSSLQRSQSRVAALRSLRRRLATGGRVIIEYTGFLSQSPLSRALTRLSARLWRADWRPEEGDLFSRDIATRNVLRYEHSFRPGEVAAECAAAGLAVVRDDVRKTPLCVAVAVPQT